MSETINTNTTTQIRNLYSDGMSYMNIKFFNTNLSFSLYPFISKDNLGKSSYDMKNGQVTTVNFEGAAALELTIEDIINGKIQECNLPIPCAGGASLNLERKLGQNGTMETIFSISKNGVTIPFKFQTMTIQVKENGQIVTKIVESGLKSFLSIVKGYSTGINADRHLDKLTEDYVNSLNKNGNNTQNNNSNYQNKFNNNSNYKKPYNNNYNKKSYNGNNYNNNDQQGWKQQDMSTYNPT